TAPAVRLLPLTAPAAGECCSRSGMPAGAGPTDRLLGSRYRDEAAGPTPLSERQRPGWEAVRVMQAGLEAWLCVSARDPHVPALREEEDVCISAPAPRAALLLNRCPMGRLLSILPDSGGGRRGHSGQPALLYDHRPGCAGWRPPVSARDQQRRPGGWRVDKG